MVVRRRNERVLGPLTLAVAAATVAGVVGPNGAGKSTLLRSLAGLEEPTEGQASVLGERVATGRRRSRRVRRGVGMMFQRHDFLPDLPFTVEDVVGFGRAPHVGLGRRLREHDRRHVEAAMEVFELGGMRRRLYRQLSGGERQKVQLARLVAQRAELLLLDEPTAGLDLDWSERLVELVTTLHRATGAAVVIVTHEVDRLPACCERVILLARGSLVASGSPASVLTPETLSRVYGCPLAVSEENGRFWARSVPR